MPQLDCPQRYHVSKRRFDNEYHVRFPVFVGPTSRANVSLDVRIGGKRSCADWNQEEKNDVFTFERRPSRSFLDMPLQHLRTGADSLPGGHLTFAVAPRPARNPLD